MAYRRIIILKNISYSTKFFLLDVGIIIRQNIIFYTAKLLSFLNEWVIVIQRQMSDFVCYIMTRTRYIWWDNDVSFVLHQHP